jgi:2,3-diketo-5-methylthio-1-phosphopentane phosphatase
MRDDYIIFIDFDGTVTVQDVGYQMFKKFTGGKTQPVVDKYRRGEVNSYTCLKTECDIWNQAPPAEREVRAYLKQQEITPGFIDFTATMRNENIGHYILSEGFDFYIDRILGFNDLSDFQRITNRARYENGEILPEFPYMASGCGECSNCKGFHIRKLTDPKMAAVFIGDGHSDFHGADSADIVFAKSFLKESLEKIGRNYFDYGDFYDIISIWKVILSRRTFAASERLFFCRNYEKSRGDFEKLWETGEVMKNVGYPRGLGWSKQNYDKFWKNVNEKDFILFGLENNDGEFIGEAKLTFPDEQNHCSHDVKLLPHFQGKGYGKEAWKILMELTYRRWPDVTLEVSPSVDNIAAIKLYRSLGFEFHGKSDKWIPPPELPNAVPVESLTMLKRAKASRGKI